MNLDMISLCSIRNPRTKAITSEGAHPGREPGITPSYTSTEGSVRGGGSHHRNIPVSMDIREKSE